MLTALFGSYAAGLVPALFLAGPLSDRLGRRRVAIPGIALSAVASLAFAAAGGSLGLLFGARFLQGVVSGVVFSVGSAWVAELSLASGEGAGGRRAAFAMTAGFSLGPLTSGLLGQYAPAPTVLSYLVHTALVVAGLAVAAAAAGDGRARPRGDAGASPAHEVPLIRPGDGWLVATVLAPVAVCVYAYPATIISRGAAARRPAGGGGRGDGRAGRRHARRRHARRRAAAAARHLDRRRGQRRSGARRLQPAAALFAATGALLWLVAGAPLLGAGQRAVPRGRAHADRPAGGARAAAAR